MCELKQSDFHGEVYSGWIGAKQVAFLFLLEWTKQKNSPT